MTYPVPLEHKFMTEPIPTASFEEGYFDEDWCDFIVSKKEYLPHKPAQTHGEGSRSTIVYPLGAYYKWIYSDLTEAVRGFNEQEYKFDIEGVPEPVQLLEYNEGDHYDWHIDLGPGEASYRKLSVIVQLSDPEEYVGGDTILDAGTPRPIPKAKGTIVVFPSYILHKVNHIVKGTRHALVCWVHGRRFR